VEGRLHQAPLVQPGFAVVREESGSKHRTQHLVGEDVFVVIEMILLEDMLDIIRMINQIRGGKHEAHAYYLSVPPGREQKSQGIAKHR
jgi:hypothetical protein